MLDLDNRNHDNDPQVLDQDHRNHDNNPQVLDLDHRNHHLIPESLPRRLTKCREAESGRGLQVIAWWGVGSLVVVVMVIMIIC